MSKSRPNPPLEKPDLPPRTAPAPVEAHLARLNRPVAVAGVLENGLVRPFDPDIPLPEHARVIIIAPQGTYDDGHRQ